MVIAKRVFVPSIVATFVGSLTLPAAAQTLLETTFKDYNCTRSNEIPLDYNSLKSLISKCDVSSIDQLLPLLPGEFLSQQTFMRQSESPEAKDVDSKHPRTLLFDKKARLVLAFTSNPKGKSFQDLQIMAFNDETKSFSFQSIHFPQKKTGKAHFDESGASCARCHGQGSKAHPIWDNYPFWANAYGSMDDTIIAGSKQDKEFREFLAAIPGTRYHHLKLPSGSMVAPYQYGEEAEKGLNLNLRPNSALGEALLKLNLDRIYSQIKNSKFYCDEKVRLRVLWELSRCNPDQTGLDQIKPIYERNDELRKKHLEGEGVPNLQAERNLPYYPEEFLIYQRVAKILDIDHLSWNLDPHAPGLPGSGGEGFRRAAMDLGKRIIEDLKRDTPELKDYPLHAESILCKFYKTRADELEAKGTPTVSQCKTGQQQTTPGSALTQGGSPLSSAHQAAQEILASDKQVKPNLLKIFQARCAKCHTGPNADPQISVQSDVDIKGYVNPTTGDTILKRIEDGTMPRGFAGATEEDKKKWNDERRWMVQELKRAASIKKE